MEKTKTLWPQSTKHQGPSSKETPSTNSRSISGYSFGNWRLGIFWSLDLGAWCFLCCLAIGASCFQVGAALPQSQGAQQIGRMSHLSITESSGLAASRQFPGVFWTHNDGQRPLLYAIKRDGTLLREFRLSGIVIGDWEDIAVDDSNRIYVADTGDNNESRRTVVVSRFVEPDPSKEAIAIEVKERWLLTYPGKQHDAEGFFVWKENGYLVTKVKKNKKAEIYTFALKAEKEPVALQFVAKVDIDSPVTGAAIAVDGSRIALVSDEGAFLIPIGGDVSSAGKGKPLKAKFKHDSIEGCSFVAEGVLATAESREIILFPEAAFQ